VDNFCELPWFVSLVPLGVGTTCLGTLDPLDYGHFMLNAVRHKNVYNTSETIENQNILPSSFIT